MAGRDFGDSFPLPSEVNRIPLRQEEWLVKREGLIEEIEHSNGRLTYRVKIWDAGRSAFITENFNDISPANDFLDRVKEENEALSRR